jgi:pectate lyase
VIQTRYGRAALTWLNLFEELGNVDGQMFLRIASKDLTAIGKHAYDLSDNSFFPVLSDGMRLSPSDCMEGVGYCSPRKLEKVPANGLMFLVYAKAYRITGESFFWNMARSLAQGLGWQEAFDATDENSANVRRDLPKGHTIQLPQRGYNQDHACGLLGLLELHRATDQREYLTLAIDLGKQIAQRYFVDGFFTTGAEENRGYTSIDNSLPLALLHLAAVVADKQVKLPVFYPNTTSFDPKVIISRRERAQKGG